MRVLIAEDDPTSRRILQLMVGRFNYEVVETVNGENAWEILTGENPPELAIIDWMMPRLAGDDLCRKLRGRPNARPLYIIMLTCKSEPDDIAKALSQGVDDYIVKPFNVNELKARLKCGERSILRQHELKANRPIPLEKESPTIALH